MTMTKRNPRFDPPELWVLGSAGDYFAEFMAGGIAVVCGHDTQDPENVLGYRPCVGMVGGRIFFRGPHQGFSEDDARLTVSDEDGNGVAAVQSHRLSRDDRTDATLRRAEADRASGRSWTAREPHEKAATPVRPCISFIMMSGTGNWAGRTDRRSGRKFRSQPHWRDRHRRSAPLRAVLGKPEVCAAL